MALSAQDVVLVLGAAGALLAAFSAGFVTIYKVIDARDKKADTKLDTIHILVNSKLDSVKEDLAAAVEYITVLVNQLDAEGVVPEPPRPRRPYEGPNPPEPS